MQRYEFRRDFCAFLDTLPGSSGGIYFDDQGAPFAMYVERASEACGRTGERYAVALMNIQQTSTVLNAISHVCEPLPTFNSTTTLCLSHIPSDDSCTIPEEHSCLNTIIREGENIQLSQEAFDIILEFLWRFKHDPIVLLENKKPWSKKINFYSNAWGGIKTIYSVHDYDPKNKYSKKYIRLDRQSPTLTQTNLQIQVGDKSIATLLIDNRLSKYHQHPNLMHIIVKGILRKFEVGIFYALNKKRTRIFEISPKSGKTILGNF